MTRFLPLLFLPGLLSVVPGCVSAERRRIRAMPSYICGAPSRAELVSIAPRSGTAQRGAPPYCVVAGTVWDAGNPDTLVPLEAVAVRELETKREVATDRDGRYRLDSIPAGPVALEAIAMGYSTAVLELGLGPGDSATVNFKMGALRLLEP